MNGAVEAANKNIKKIIQKMTKMTVLRNRSGGRAAQDQWGEKGDMKNRTWDLLKLKEKLTKSFSLGRASLSKNLILRLSERVPHKGNEDSFK